MPVVPEIWGESYRLFSVLTWESSQSGIQERSSPESPWVEGSELEDAADCAARVHEQFQKGGKHLESKSWKSTEGRLKYYTKENVYM